MEISIDELDKVATVLGCSLEDMIKQAREMREQEKMTMQKAEHLLREAKKAGLKDTLLDTLKLVVDPSFYENLVKEAAKLNGEEDLNSQQNAES